MSLTDVDLLAALRSQDPIEAVCGRIRVPFTEFEAARDAFLRRCAATTTEQLTGAIAGKVEIKRDHAGVPHVYANTSTDLFFGLGVAMSQDRLWQMDRLRRRALGRQAEVLGPAYVASDVAHLTVGIDQISIADAAAMDDATHALVVAFVAGINRYIEALGADLPIEFRLLDYAPEPFSVRDIVAIGRGIWWSLNGRIDRLAAAECARLLPNDTIRTLFLTPEAAENLVAPWTASSGSLHAAGTD
ncbi:MAG: penicillin acylase family protein, partial [Acetobacteraceae bacterium]